MKTIIEQLKDKTPFFISGLFALILIIYAYGCEPKTQSLLTKGERVNREELNLELDVVVARHQMGIHDLKQQEAIRNYVFQQTLNIASGNPVSTVGVVTGLLAILGVGATADDVRLRRQRKTKADEKSEPVEVH